MIKILPCPLLIPPERNPSPCHNSRFNICSSLHTRQIFNQNIYITDPPPFRGNQVRAPERTELEVEESSVYQMLLGLRLETKYRLDWFTSVPELSSLLKL